MNIQTYDFLQPTFAAVPWIRQEADDDTIQWLVNCSTPKIKRKKIWHCRPGVAHLSPGQCQTKGNYSEQK